MDADLAYEKVSKALFGLPVFMAGSLTTAVTYGKQDAYDDVDVFCPNIESLMVAGQKLIAQGWKPDDRYARVWKRWLSRGVDNWHTNSLKFVGPHRPEVNLVFKLENKHPITSLSGILESFDFGILATGTECETLTPRDLRSYLFPDFNGAYDNLPMLPSRRSDWRNGFISQYQGLREFGRYAKYAKYGYNMTMVKDDLLTGYANIIVYLTERGDKERQDLADIYETVVGAIEKDDFDTLVEAGKKIPTLDTLDQIMEALS